MPNNFLIDSGCRYPLSGSDFVSVQDSKYILNTPLRNGLAFGSDREFIYKVSLDNKQAISVIEQILIKDYSLEAKNEFQFDFDRNLIISQMSDLVAFIWSDSLDFYIKTFKDSIWYETTKISLNSLSEIGNNVDCSIYNNQQIWISFDAKSGGNRDIYALSVPASFVVDTTLTAINQTVKMSTPPNSYTLFQNYPNPFNSSTTIRYRLPQPGLVNLSIYNIRGQNVNTLVNAWHAAGTYNLKWQGTDELGQTLPGAVYFCRLKMGKWKTVRKLVLSK